MRAGLTGLPVGLTTNEFACQVASSRGLTSLQGAENSL
jgi:hypothetical protein